MHPPAKPSDAVEPASSPDLFERFFDWATREPHRPAVADETGEWSYGRLLDEVRRASALLPPAEGGKPSLVALCLPAGIPAVVGVLAALGRGHGFVGVDEARTPRERMEMLSATLPRAILGSRGRSGLVPDRAPCPVAWLEDAGPVREEPWATGQRELLGVFFTSGSTGHPKGIIQTNRVVAADIDRARRDTGLGASDHLDNWFGVSFSAFLSPTFGALANGAKVSFPPSGARPASEQAAWMRERAITYATMTPGMWRHLCRGLSPGEKLDSIRLLGLSAERFGPHDVALLRDHLPPDTVVQNAVASTEARTYLQAFCPAAHATAEALLRVDPVTEKGVAVRIEDEASGEGEITLATRLRSPGFWLPAFAEEGLPETSPAAWPTGDWVRREPGGGLRFMGRRADHAKVRGERVDLGEVEDWIRTQPGVEAAAVVAADTPSGGATLVAFVQPAPDAPAAAEPETLRRAANRALRESRRPTTWITLAEWPRTHTGKPDRPALLARYAEWCSGQRSEQPAGSGWLQEAWATVLRHRSFGRRDSFFSVGGDSLSAIELAACIERHTGRPVSPENFWLHPTLEAQETWLATGPDPEIFPRVRAGNSSAPLIFVPPRPSVAGTFRHLAPLLSERWDVYRFDYAALPDLRESESVEVLGARLAEAAVKQWPAGALVLAGYSMGGFVAWETARLLMAAGRRDIRLILLDSCRWFSRLTEEELAPWRRSRAGWRRTRDLLGLLAFPRGCRRSHLWEDFVAPRFARWLRAPAPGGADGGKLASVEAFESRNYGITRAYRVAPAECPTLLVRATRQGHLFNVLSRDLGWRKACRGRFEVADVPVRHQDLLGPSAAPQVAEATNRFLG